ncbi:unnamed protein product [Closterium sp. Naga37s-1]|nr:unnamed protein product [Closterium sp. Naga37s-1]
MVITLSLSGIHPPSPVHLSSVPPFRPHLSSSILRPSAPCPLSALRSYSPSPHSALPPSSMFPPSVLYVLLPRFRYLPYPLFPFSPPSVTSPSAFPPTLPYTLLPPFPFLPICAFISVWSVEQMSHQGGTGSGTAKRIRTGWPAR